MNVYWNIHIRRLDITVRNELLSLLRLFTE